MNRNLSRLSALARPHGGTVPALLAVVAAVLLAGTPPAAAADQPRIVVHLTDEAGAPVVGAQVELREADKDQKPKSDAPATRQKTNKKGQATFAFLKGNASYIVRPVVEGQVAVRAEVKTRNPQRKPIPEVEDQAGAIDPSLDYLPVSIHPEADIVDITLTMGNPKAAAAATGQPGADPSSIDVQDAQLKKELTAAVEQIQNNQFAEGLATVDALLAAKRAEMKPEDLASVLYMRGFALFRLDRGTEAEPPLKEALQLNPNFTGAWDLLANIYIQQKRYPEAAEALKNELAAVEDPNRRTPLLLNYGLALMQQGKHEEAVAPLEEARSLAPTDSAVIVQLADAYMSAGRGADAEKLLEGAADLPPAEGAALHFNLAAALMRSKNFAGAEQHFVKAVELNPQLVEARRYTADAQLAQGKRAEALATLEAYLAAAPNAEDAAEVKQIVAAMKKEKRK